MESFAAVLMFKINIFCYKAFELFGLFQTCVELTEPARPKGNQDIVHHTWKKSRHPGNPGNWLPSLWG